MGLLWGYCLHRRQLLVRVGIDLQRSCFPVSGGSHLLIFWLDIVPSLLRFLFADLTSVEPLLFAFFGG